MAFELSDEALAAIVPVIAYWLFSGFYELVAYVHPNSRLHPKEEEYKKNLVSRAAVARSVLTAQAIQIIFVMFVLKFMKNDEGIPKPQPSFLMAACQIFMAMVILDSWQYFGHRYMHVNKFLYKHSHSSHHALIIPYSFGGHYNHWFEQHVMDTIGGALAVVIPGLTPRTSMYFFCLAIVKSVELHSDLWLPWSPFQMLFSNNPAIHQTHHQFNGHHCNYAQPFFLTWDKLLGTYRPYTVEKRKGGGYQVSLCK